MSKWNTKKQIFAKTATLVVAGLSLLCTACSPEQVDELTNNSVGGTVSGLQGTLVLSNNHTDEIVITGDGAFTFPSELGVANRYRVEVVEQPAGQTCWVQNASGVVTVSEVRDVTVVCSAVQHFVGFTVVGLNGTLAVLNNGTDVTTISTDGSFVFPTYLVEGSNYNVTVSSQPMGQTCVITNGSGTANADVTDILITCSP